MEDVCLNRNIKEKRILIEADREFFKETKPILTQKYFKDFKINLTFIFHSVKPLFL